MTIPIRQKYEPIVVCRAHKISMHDNDRVNHERRWYSRTTPCDYVYPSAERMRAAGWTPDDFTRWPYSEVAP